MNNYYPNSFWQIREALVVEIRDAQRWSVIEDAFLALGECRTENSTSHE